MKWEITIKQQGSIHSILYSWAMAAIDAINQVEDRVNPANNEGKRKYFYLYEARQVKPGWEHS